MINSLIILLICVMSSLPSLDPIIIFNFSTNENKDGWYIMDDVVMGGRSEGDFEITESGVGLFSGNVSLKNYGGFSSIRYGFAPKDIEGYKECVFKIKGDKKRYQLRFKSSMREPHSYIQHFETSGEWEIITLKFADFYPSFRGRRLSTPNFPAELMCEMSFLIANKKEEAFNLQFEWMELR